MKVIRVKSAGFCMGVRRAMGTLLDQARNGRKPVRTLGPLIHNPQVIEMLRAKGVEILNSKDETPAQGTVVIRAHGVAPEQSDALCAGGCEVVDATCPHVIRIQKLIERHIEQDDSILIIGDHGHAEVNGLMGYAAGRGYVVETAGDIDALPALDRVCVVSQTTQSPENFDTLLDGICQRWPDCTVHRTICNSTRERQRETVEVARLTDAMIVVGGRNSANTVRLAELAAETGTPTLHIETPEELDLEKIKGAKTVGLTAGASTPNWMIANTHERLNAYSREEWWAPRRYLYRACQLLLDTNLFIAAGAACMAFGCAGMVRQAHFGVIEAWAATLYLFGVHSVNVLYERQPERYSNPLRWRFHERWGGFLIVAGFSAILLALVLAAQLGFVGFALMLAMCVAGILYPLPIVPKSLAPDLRHRRLSDMPGSKDIFTGLAWACVLALPPLLPTAQEGAPPLLQSASVKPALAVALAFFFVFTLAFVRSVILDMRDIQGDQMIGRETIPVALGHGRTRLLLVALTAAMLAAMLAATYSDVLTPMGYLMLLPLLYTAFYLYLYHKRVLAPHGVFFEMVIGGPYFLVGLIAALYARFS